MKVFIESWSKSIIKGKQPMISKNKRRKKRKNKRKILSQEKMSKVLSTGVLKTRFINIADRQIGLMQPV